MKKLCIPVFLLAALVFGLAACTSSDAPSNEAVAAGAAGAGTSGGTGGGEVPPSSSLGEAPDFTLPTLAGDSLRLSDLRGQIVVLNFWATWCAPCIEEIPDLIALHDELNPHGLSVVGIAIDVEGAELVKPFTERLGITYPVPLDEGAVAEAFGGVWALPTTYVIDPEGRIDQRVIGLFPVKEMRVQFRQQLGLQPVSTTAH